MNRPGRPLALVDPAQVRDLRASGMSYSMIAGRLGASRTTVIRICLGTWAGELGAEVVHNPESDQAKGRGRVCLCCGQRRPEEAQR